MKLNIVDGNQSGSHFQTTLISYVIDDQIAIDAGALALLPLAAQKQISSIFLSHVHADHIASLPLFVDNVFSPGRDCVRLFASQYSIEQLQRHIFNDVIWPDVLRLANDEANFIEFVPIEHGVALEIIDYRITAFNVEHTIPAFGFVVEHHGSAVAIVSDTWPSDSIWELLEGIENLSAVFLEISFPNSMLWLAEKSKHLTPALFQTETSKLQREVSWFITHVKPEYKEAIHAEVDRLEIANCQFARAAHDYFF